MKDEAAAQQRPSVRAEPPARPNKADLTAHTAANLYALMAWLYDRPRN